MVRIIKNRILYVVFGVLWLYVPMAHFIKQDDLYMIMGGLTVAAALSTVHAYSPALYLAMTMKQNDVEYVDFLTLGIVGIWLSVAARIGYLTYIRYINGPLPYDTYFFTFTQYVIFVCALLHLSARRVVRNQVPQSSVPRIIWTLSFGLAIGGILSWTN
jgi:hypothetical protein